MSPLRVALVAQILGGIIAAALTYVFRPDLLALTPSVAAVQGGCAALVSHRLRAPVWWLPIHLAFLPSAVMLNRLDIPPGWYLAAFVLLLLVFWRTDKSRVPLFLTNATATDAVATLLPRSPSRFIDLGCGDGGLLRRLAHARPDCDFLGIEHAPLPWLWAKLATLGLPNCRIRHGDFWHQHLGRHDVVYAFLSPAPMLRLWAKARNEMRPESLLVSNGFPVPDVEAEQVIEVGDKRQTRLYCYFPSDPRQAGKRGSSED
ncbi:MAG: methyltransferase type 12 [Rhodocyclaceae bacterium]|nr:methyltransferase type 12 [Rhodocyclaceae bacterium]